MENDKELLQESLCAIALELFRFQQVFQKVLGKLTLEDQKKYRGQFSWFAGKVNRALEGAGLRLCSLEGQIYDPGMAVTPLNLDEFAEDEKLYILQMIEPIIMQEDRVFRMGTVVLGRCSQ